MSIKKISSMVLAALLLVGTAGISAIAAEKTPIDHPYDENTAVPEGMTAGQFHSIYEIEHWPWEKEADGVYVGGVKVEETGYYTYTSSGEMSKYGTLNEADESDYNIYVNLEDKTIILNGIDLEVKAGEMPYIENVYNPKYVNYVLPMYADGDTGVPGVLVVEEGTYHDDKSGVGGAQVWDSPRYWPYGYNADYDFAAIGLGIMTDDGTSDDEWTIELIGKNTIDVYSEFAHSYQRFSMDDEYNLDAAVYGIFGECEVVISGEGTLDVEAKSNWDNIYSGVGGTKVSASASGIWSVGNLTIESGTITSETSTLKQETAMFDFDATLKNTLAAIGSGSVVSIEGGTVTATDKTDLGIGILGNTGVEISGGTVVATSDADVAGAGIASQSEYINWFFNGDNGYVDISGGTVTATAVSSEEVIEYYANSEDYSGGAPGVGIAVAGSTDETIRHGITISAGIVTAIGSGAGINADSSTVTVGANATVTATAEESGFEIGGAVVADRGTVSLAAGTYNTILPETYIAQGSAIVDGTVMAKADAESAGWTARLGASIYYAEENGGAQAIADADFSMYATANNVIWINKNTTAERTGLVLGDTITVHVADGVEFNLTLKGDKLIPVVNEITAEASLAADDVTYTTYKYTMLPDPEYAVLKVVSEGKEDRYSFDFGSNYHKYSANWYAENGDTIVLLDDIIMEDDNITIYDFVTVDLNGHTISSDYMYYTVYISSSDEGTIIFTDSSEAENGAIINTGNGYAISNSFRKITLAFEGGNYSAVTKPVIRTAIGLISDGDFTGTLEAYSQANKNFTGYYEISGGRYSVSPDVSFIAEGYEVLETGETDLPYAVGVKSTNTINVAFADVTPDTARDYKLYNINLESANADNINRLNSADLTFVLSQLSGNNAYEIIDIADDSIAVNNVEGDRYEFHFETKTDVTNDTATSITIAQVKVTGYGKYSFAVAEADTNVAHATEALDNIVDTFIPNGDTTKGEGVLNIGNGTGEVEIFAPTQNLTIKVAFPNAIEDNKLAYQAMNVTVTGEDISDISIDLGEDNQGEALTLTNKTNAAYTVAFDEENSVYTIVISNALTANTAYGVTVTGAGYRTARYTVNMQEADKTLNFWNNVKDNAAVVEEGKDSSAKTVTYLAGDIVKDGTINIYDLSAVVSYFGEINLTTTEGAEKYAKYDLNRDGKIDSKDVAYVLVSWAN